MAWPCCCRAHCTLPCFSMGRWPRPGTGTGLGQEGCQQRNGRWVLSSGVRGWLWQWQQLGAQRARSQERGAGGTGESQEEQEAWVSPHQASEHLRLSSGLEETREPRWGDWEGRIIKQKGAKAPQPGCRRSKETPKFHEQVPTVKYLLYFIWLRTALFFFF